METRNQPNENEIKNFIRSYKNLSDEQVILFFLNNEYLGNGDLEALFSLSGNDLSETTQKKIIKVNEDWIKYLDSPSESLQMIAVKNYAHLLREIKMPTKKVILYCLGYDKDAVSFASLYPKDKEFVETMINRSLVADWDKDYINDYINGDVKKALSLMDINETVISFISDELIKSPEFDGWIEKNYKKINFSRFNRRICDFSLKSKRLAAKEWHIFRDFDTEDSEVVKAYLTRQDYKLRYLKSNYSIGVIGRELNVAEIDLVISISTDSFYIDSGTDITDVIKISILRHWPLIACVQHIGWIDASSHLATVAKQNGKEILVR
ncbi:hypothetical protein OM416_19560 [Paenibacillus sp. LS1]|uniref:hypothetical protein n=1 Tax=Paenibacillus sp. LS1 TaxID=2992120 RepID=UPI00222FB547|nr:hypothetical protein [Paenibacillus sp. LS1]MCW3793794.1 hypothetical protein [Paenibacillus sp. LS1]